MKIQSLSVCVPTGRCVNNCAFCVSKMHNDDYPNKMDIYNPDYDIFSRDYINRMAFARDNGCNTVMLTGTAEPQQNMSFLKSFGVMNRGLSSPFRWIEIQTTGVLMTADILKILRHYVGVSTVSLSMSSFDCKKNMEYNGTPEKLAVNLIEFSSLIKKMDFNLRLSLNMTEDFEKIGVENVFRNISAMKADQVTFRKLYSKKGTDQSYWIDAHSCQDSFLISLGKYVRDNGSLLGILEYGQEQWSLNDVSYVFDNDCMAKEVGKKTARYLVLRPNARLYSSWDDKASLIF